MKCSVVVMVLIVVVDVVVAVVVIVVVQGEGAQAAPKRRPRVKAPHLQHRSLDSANIPEHLQHTL